VMLMSKLKTLAEMLINTQSMAMEYVCARAVSICVVWRNLKITGIVFVNKMKNPLYHSDFRTLPLIQNACAH
jgi:hypothetical protein